MDTSTYTNAFLFLFLFFFFFFFFFPFLLILLSIFTANNESKNLLQLPPGPKPWPILRNISLFIMTPNEYKNPHITLSQLSHSHGPLISIKLGAQLIVVASSSISASQILKTHDRTFSGRFLYKTNPFELNVLDQVALFWAPTCGQGWKSLRTLCRTELFSPKAVEAQSVVRERKVGEMIKFLSEKGGDTVNIGEVVFATVFDSLCDIFFSMDLLGFGQGDDNWMLKSQFRELMDLAIAPNVVDFFPIFEGFDPQGTKKKMSNVVGKIFYVWECHVKKRRETRNTKVEGDCILKEDFLDVFLRHEFDDYKIDWLFFELLIGGTDTTTSTIKWAMRELLKNREVMSKLREELTQKIGVIDPITESKASQLKFLNACIKETLRLHPPAPFLPYWDLETCKVMGYAIPKGSQVLVNVWAIGRDQSTWVDPLTFKPERFIDGSTLTDFKGMDFEFIPFGPGRRMCPGLPMVAKQLPLILGSLVRGFDWSLPGGRDLTKLDMREKFGLTLHKDRPLVLVVDKHHRHAK